MGTRFASHRMPMSSPAREKLGTGTAAAAPATPAREHCSYADRMTREPSDPRLSSASFSFFVDRHVWPSSAPVSKHQSVPRAEVARRVITGAVRYPRSRYRPVGRVLVAPFVRAARDAPRVTFSRTHQGAIVVLSTMPTYYCEKRVCKTEHLFVGKKKEGNWRLEEMETIPSFLFRPWKEQPADPAAPVPCDISCVDKQFRRYHAAS